MEYQCVLCKQMCVGYGNNPYPLANTGSCCEDCNETKVIPARIVARQKEEQR